MSIEQSDLAWVQLFEHLDRAGLALHLQIRRTVVAAIETGQLSQGTRLVSSRKLGALLGVARNTVVDAYQQMIDERFLVARERSGIFVAPHKIAPPAAGTRAGWSFDWSERFAVRPSALRHISKPRDWLDYRYPFLFGQFDPSLFPANDWRESVRAASSVSEITGWGSDLIDEDDPALVEQLRLHVLPQRAILAAPDEVMITIGAQQALSLVVRLLVGRDTPAGIEDPGYPDIRNMLTLATTQIRHLGIDKHGVIPDETFGSCDVAFVDAGHQCPTTSVMPLARRRALLEVAAHEDVAIVEDDYEADVFVEGESEVPSLKSLDRSGRVIYIGSFSKVLAPGLRLGFVVAPPAVIAELRVLRRLDLRHPPSNNQRATAMFIALGHYRSHLRRIAGALAERATRIDAALPTILPQCAWQRDPGATSFWIRAPAGVDARDLTVAARERGVLIEPGDVFFADPAAGRRYFRLGFTSIPASRIEAGLAELGRLLPRGTGSRSDKLEHGLQPADARDQR